MVASSNLPCYIATSPKHFNCFVDKLLVCTFSEEQFWSSYQHLSQVQAKSLPINILSSPWREFASTSRESIFETVASPFGMHIMRATKRCFYSYHCLCLILFFRQDHSWPLTMSGHKNVLLYSMLLVRKRSKICEARSKSFFGCFDCVPQKSWWISSVQNE